MCATKPHPVEATIVSLEEKYEMKLMVLTDLAAVCKKLSDSSAITEDQRVQVRHFVDVYNQLVPFYGEGTPEVVFEAHKLLIQMARFLPNVVED